MKAYHGTTKENALKICEEGFSSEYFGKNGNHFGDGIYLASTKKRARLYGKVIICVELDESGLFQLDNWYPTYMERCRTEFEKGTPHEAVNSVVGKAYQDEYTHQGYTGILMPPPLGTGSEMVIFDTSIIQEIWKDGRTTRQAVMVN